MSKKALMAIFNDVHLTDENCEQTKDLIKQICEYCKDNGITKLSCLGDLFDSRKKQSEDVLNTFGGILDMVADYGLKLNMIPGNHDKTSYESENSFLDPFMHHPALQLYRIYGGITFKEYGIYLHFIPFFSNEKWIENFKSVKEYLGEFKDDEKHILCTHIAVEGSSNNDGKRVESDIHPKLFNKFYKVFLGHYHNEQKIGSNIFHLHSIKQKDFGEDDKKGFTVLYSDGSHESVLTTFKNYINLKVDLDKVSKSEINKMLIEYTDKASESFVRFTFTGSEDKLKSISKEQFQVAGIDVKVKNKDIEVIEDFDTVIISKYDLDSVYEIFLEFCEEFGENKDEGLKYLKQVK